eukprot:3676105-Pleurochrysis_carterae.AAC.3
MRLLLLSRTTATLSSLVAESLVSLASRERTLTHARRRPPLPAPPPLFPAVHCTDHCSASGS